MKFSSTEREEFDIHIDQDHTMDRSSTSDQELESDRSSVSSPSPSEERNPLPEHYDRQMDLETQARGKKRGRGKTEASAKPKDPKDPNVSKVNRRFAGVFKRPRDEKEESDLTYGLDRGHQALLLGTSIIGAEAWLISFGKDKHRLTDNQGRMRKEVHVALRPGFDVQTERKYIKADLESLKKQEGKEAKERFAEQVHANQARESEEYIRERNERKHPTNKKLWKRTWKETLEIVEKRWDSGERPKPPATRVKKVKRVKRESETADPPNHSSATPNLFPFRTQLDVNLFPFRPQPAVNPFPSRTQDINDLDTSALQADPPEPPIARPLRDPTVKKESIKSLETSTVQGESEEPASVLAARYAEGKKKQSALKEALRAATAREKKKEEEDRVRKENEGRLLREKAASKGPSPDQNSSVRRPLTEREIVLLKMTEDYHLLTRKVLENAPELHEDDTFHNMWISLQKCLTKDWARSFYQAETWINGEIESYLAKKES